MTQGRHFVAERDACMREATGATREPDAVWAWVPRGEERDDDDVVSAGVSGIDGQDNLGPGAGLGWIWMGR